MSACLKMGNFPLVDHHIANEKVLKAHTHTIPMLAICLGMHPMASHINMAISWGQFPIELEKVDTFSNF